MSVVEFVTKLFPAPQYISLPSVGIDVSDSSLKYVQFVPDRTSGSRLELAHWGDIDVPSGVLESGEVKDHKILSEIIKEVKAQTGCEYVRLSLPEERAYLFETEIAKDTSQKEVRGLLEFTLEENVPIPPRDVVFDYDLVPGLNTKDKIHLSVTAYARNTINGYYEACVAAGVLPLSFEVEAQAIARALLPKNDITTTMIVDFGKTRTGIGIVHRGVLMYTSTIDIGGAELSSALRRQLGNLSDTELVDLKNMHGLIRGVDNADVYEAVLSTMSAIQNEVSTRINYWNTRPNARADQFIRSIVLCGGSCNLRGLPGYFTETLGIPTKRAKVWENAFSLNDIIPPIGQRYSYGYATAIGLALTSFHSLYE